VAVEIFETLPDLQYFENLPLSCTDEYFFEGMVANIRMSILSAQANIHFEKNRAVRTLINELMLLKQDYNRNFLRIKEVEQVLTDLNENKLRDELEN
jgi:hypothetical protein